MPDAEPLFRTELHHGVSLIQLDDPSGFPRLTRARLSALSALFHDLRSRRAVQGIVLTGTDQSFAAGAELSEITTLTAAEALRFAALGQDLMDTIQCFPMPVVTAIRGYCLGGGFDLALACHLRIATPDAVFGHPGGSLGLMTGWGGTQRLPRLVGRTLARELLLTNRQLTAAEALACNLIHTVVDSARLLAEARQMVSRASNTSA